MSADADINWINWAEAFDFMHAIEDQAVKNLLRLVCDSVVRNDIEGVRPAAPFDLLYCFRTLAQSFSNRAELVIAVRGDNPDDYGPVDWI
jgi:hypothetical protein